MNAQLETARKFVDMHKNSDIENWHPLGVSGAGKLETIYHNLVNDVYGETREENPGELQIEISGNESYNGHPVLFEFERLNDE